MIVLDTNVLIFEALDPSRLTVAAREAIMEGRGRRILACCDISIWEIAMLVAKKRLDPGTDRQRFLEDIILSNHLRVLRITPPIAVLAQSGTCPHGDTADRLIAATTLRHHARLVNSDGQLQAIKALNVIW